MDLFATSAIDLSMTSSTGEQLTANVYLVDGVYNTDGSLRELSMGQLVMAICLNRASELEETIVSLMETMSRQSANIEALTKAEEALVEKTSTDTYADVTVDSVSYYDSSNAEQSTTSLSTLLAAFDISTSGTYDDVISRIDSKLDELNSLSQETLIEIQSKTSKRDDTYNLITNVLKSLNTTLTGNVNNI